MMELTLGVITVSVTTIISFILWLLKRRKDFKRLFAVIKGDGLKKDKKTFKLKYAFYKKLIKLLTKNIETKYLKDVFKDGDINYEKIVKEIIDFIGAGDKSKEVV